MGKSFKVGTRPSPLAIKQTEEVINLLLEKKSSIKTEIIRIETRGDRDKETLITEIEGSDFFTDEIETALLKKEIDMAVHSAKDVPAELDENLRIFIIKNRYDRRDAFVSKTGISLANLRAGAIIGTSSTRRKEGLKKFRDDLEVVDIRGTIEERITKLKNTGLDGIVIAACALERLGLEYLITERIPPDIIQPHPLQSFLAIEVRRDDTELIDMLGTLEFKT